VSCAHGVVLVLYFLLLERRQALGAWVGERPVSVVYGDVCRTPGGHWAHGGIGCVAAFGVWRHRVRWACGRRRRSVWVGVVSDGVWCRGHVAVTGLAGHGARTHDVRLVLRLAGDVAVAGPYWTSGMWLSLGRVRCQACGDVVVS
jgi:hypothetical protein